MAALPDVVLGVIMGLVEGLTEFIPVSSTGHLILVGHALGFTGEVAETFEVVIQIGAILAVVVHDPLRFRELLRPVRGVGLQGVRGLTLLAITTIPGAVVGLLGRDAIKAVLFTPSMVAVGLLFGSVLMVGAERWRREGRVMSVDGITWRLALGVGLFQALALWPGTSRAAATIAGGLLLGMDRETATRYSFLAAVPLLAGATMFDLYASLGHLDGSHVPLFATGLVVSFLSAWAAIRWLLAFLRTHTLVPFAVYRVALAAVVLVGLL